MNEKQMLFNFISNAVTAATKVTSVVKTMECRMPNPEYWIKWDSNEGKIKLEEKERDIFDPIVY